MIIITNSDEGWVKYSCERFVPRLIPIIEKYKIVSARTRYERFYPGQPLCWKAAAFAHEVNEFYERAEEREEWVNASMVSLESTDVSSDSDSETSKPAPAPRQVISFGDSMEERTAVRIVAEQLNATPKSVMFIQTPTPSQIVGQLNMLTSHMKFVCDHTSSLDLEISADQAERCASNYLRRQKVHVEDTYEIADEMAKMILRQASSSDSSSEASSA